MSGGRGTLVWGHALACFEESFVGIVGCSSRPQLRTLKLVVAGMIGLKFSLDLLGWFGRPFETKCISSKLCFS